MQIYSFSSQPSTGITEEMLDSSRGKVLGSFSHVRVHITRLVHRKLLGHIQESKLSVKKKKKIQILERVTEIISNKTFGCSSEFLSGRESFHLQKPQETRKSLKFRRNMRKLGLLTKTRKMREIRAFCA